MLDIISFPIESFTQTFFSAPMLRLLDNESSVGGTAMKMPSGQRKGGDDNDALSQEPKLATELPNTRATLSSFGVPFVLFIAFVDAGPQPI